MKISVDIMALGLSIIALVVSVLQFFSERNRGRKEATIHAFDELEVEVFGKESYKKIIIKASEEYALSGKPSADMNLWNEATLFLSRIEHFSVGVNSGIYDLDTLNRMAGGFMIAEYHRWLPIIERKRRDDPSQKHYNEFEKLILSLEKKHKT